MLRVLNAGDTEIKLSPRSIVAKASEVEGSAAVALLGSPGRSDQRPDSNFSSKTTTNNTGGIKTYPADCVSGSHDKHRAPSKLDSNSNSDLHSCYKAAIC